MDWEILRSYFYGNKYFAIKFPIPNSSNLPSLLLDCQVTYWLCVCVCVGARARTSIHREDFICWDQLDYQGTDQRCYVDDFSFLCQVKSLHHYFRTKHETFLTSHFIMFTHYKRAEPRLN